MDVILLPKKLVKYADESVYDPDFGDAAKDLKGLDHGWGQASSRVGDDCAAYWFRCAPETRDKLLLVPGSKLLKEASSSDKSGTDAMFASVVADQKPGGIYIPARGELIAYQKDAVATEETKAKNAKRIAAAEDIVRMLVAVLMSKLAFGLAVAAAALILHIPEGAVLGALSVNASDNFGNGSNGNNLAGIVMDAAGGGSGNTWASAGTDWKKSTVGGNKAENASGFAVFANDGTMADAAAAGAKCTVQTALDSVGPAVHVSNGSDANCYGFFTDPFTGFRLRKYVSGTPTALGIYDVVAPSGGEVMEIDIDASGNLDCYIDTVHRIGPTNDPDLASGRNGLLGKSSGSVKSYVGYTEAAGGSTNARLLQGLVNCGLIGGRLVG